ncbi:aminoglycoside phosphotransferase family protein [Planktotalea sp.]|uniref:aminoglycoside phosphotransferase family protein n=1 Tax=Planktotalea sp. TaxID=2029877 RepID=UPI003297521B
MTEKTINTWEHLELAPSISQCLKSWSLTDPMLITVTNMGAILRVTRVDGSFAVLKCLSDIGQREESLAASTLRAFSGNGAVEVYEASETALLMEHCAGGQLDTFAAETGAGDAAALPIIGEVVRALHRNQGDPPDALPTLEQRCAVLTEVASLAADVETRGLFKRAEEISQALLSSTSDALLLHGDLHHGNILQTNRGGRPTWVCIDPQGVWGDRAYDVSNIFGNPIGQPDLFLDRDRPLHLAQFFSKELDLCQSRILKWGFVHANISAAWALQDGDDPRHRLQLARHILNVL